MKTKIFTLFVALLATTSLWARPFQVGDLYYKIAGNNGVAKPTVSNPGAGRTTVVLYYVPENTPEGCYAVGTVNSWDSNNTDFMFTPIEGAGTGWVACTFDYEPNMQIKVLAIPSDPDFLGWAYQWGKNIHWENDLEEDNVVILDGTGYLELESQGEPKLVGLEDDGVVYVEIKEWASDPYVDSTPCTTAAFKHPWGSGDWTYREATKTAQATFEINAIYGGSGLSVATDVYATNERWYYDQIEFVGDVAQGDSVNFKFISEKQTIGRMIVTLIGKETITVKAKVPATWTNTITAWVWPTDGEGIEVTPTKEGDWYVYTKKCAELNIIFKNGRGWTGGANQTVDITGIKENTCLVLESDGYNKATYTYVDCDNPWYMPSKKSPTVPQKRASIDSRRKVVVTYQSESSDNYAYLTTAYIPETVVYNGITYEVVGIDDGAFANSPITSITIPNSVTNIGDRAFSGCSSLKSIIVKEGNPVYDSRNNCNAIVETATNTVVVGCQATNMPSSITSIGSGAFAYCTSLTSIYIPNSVTSIGGSAFSSCSSLNSITIPNSVTSIGSDAFQNCNSLKSITIPNSVTSIGSYAFAFCESLKEVILPNSITSIEYRTFYGCSSLISITIPNSVTSIGDYAFRDCSSLTSITIPNSVTSIEYGTFYNCEKLGTLVLGDKIKEIGDHAFEECNKLYHIYCYAPEPPVIDENVFTNYNVNLYVPCNYLDNYKYDRVFGSFRYIQCIDSEDVAADDVVVTPGTNDVTITWPTEGNADTYTIVIKKGNEVFCTLTFNAEGQLLNIAFAPGRDGNHPVQYAEQAVNGYRFTVTNLESGTKYGYNIDVKDASNKTIKSHSGEFTTQSTTAVDNITTNNANIQKIMRDGQLIILRNGVEYNAVGQEVGN